MNENKTTTYGDLKCRKEELRNIMANGDLTESTIEEYRQVLQAIKDAELTLLWGITPNEACGELVKPKTYKRVKIVVIAVSIAVILAILFLSGCHTVNGVGRDLSAWSSPYIEHQEK